ncbi:MAG: molybdopterin-dependent oxidoreductase [Syntrophobacteraceae bacterium]|nr:molybdopterin-dependent oxidoreductase [Syntrophobacteraceae bacterium]
MKEVAFTLNGIRQACVVEDGLVLIDYLRKTKGLTGTKQSCDRKGQCGACTVLVNKKAALSCLTRVESLEGADVITIEGLGAPENPHLIQEAFALSGAVQCGFCTPGMIMATKALLEKNPDPDTDAIKKALAHNLCRCTGYKKIIEAVTLAGRFLRGEIRPEEVRPAPGASSVGVSHPRPNALLLATGKALFSADIHKEGVLELAAVRSPLAHALIKSIDVSMAEKVPGVVAVMTAKDILGTNRLKEDQPVICDKKVQVMGDAVAVVIAETRESALAGAEAVKVDYEPLPVLTSPEEALAEGAIRIHEKIPNLCYSQPQIKGDAQSALANSFVVVEEAFSTQCIHQSPLEPEASLAYFEDDPDGPQLVVVGRSINIHQHLKTLQDALGWEDMRYFQPFSGGQFGIKADITAEGLTAAAALHVKRPVRYVCSLTESMWITTKRHPFDMKVRLGADAAGKITGYEIDFTVDNGAYVSVGKSIVGRALYMLSGSYNIPDLAARSRLVYTNNPAGGAARGAGPPQVNFALESAMEILAERLGLDPLELRLRNSLEPGQSISTGQVVDEWPYPGCLEAVRKHYERAKKDCASKSNGRFKRGVGLAGGSFGIGKGGPDRSQVAVELMADGGLTVYGSVSDPGEGNDAMLTQISSHLTGIPAAKIRLETRDTGNTPDSSSSSGSRVTYMSGGALVNAIETMKKAMAEAGAKDYNQLVAMGKPTRYMGTKIADTTALDPQNGQCAPFESRVHGVQMAEVEVDTQTGEVKIVKMTAVVDPGTVLNPKIVEGQIEGGLDMGAGMALREHYVHGRTRDWVTSRFPTTRTAFDMEIVLLETPRKKGPLGAVGVGEFVLLPTLAAIITAIRNATGGERIRDLPATPEKVLRAMGKG